MDFIDVTAEVFHVDKSWLNDEAPQNIQLISVTADVSQDDMLPSKADASWNICIIVVTAEVFHVDKSWLNDEASWNMKLISVTADVFQDDISPSKADAP